MTLESLEHVLLWAPIHLIHRLAPSPLLMVTGVEDSVHAIDEVLKAYERAWQPKRLELLPVDEIGLSIEPGLGMSMNLAVEFFDQHLRKKPRFVPSPSADEAWALGQVLTNWDGHSALKEVTFYHYQNGTWTPVKPPATRIRSLR
jgi:hypothetical protein